MHDRLVGILDTADEVVARALTIAPPGTLAGAAGIVARLRDRIDFPDDMAVVAIAGGTGSGKSSLFNALLSTDRAEVGGLRPTTARPLISVPAGRQAEIGAYLDWAEPAEITTHDEPTQVVLIDLPDTDSVETQHRRTVEDLLPRVDAVIWVVDVEKYRDDSLHSGFLRGASAHEPRFLFALNQIDRVDEDDAEEVVADFVSALIADGFSEPSVFAVSAHPPVGPPIGVEPVKQALMARAEGSMLDKFAADLTGAISAMVALVGGSGTDFDESWEAMRESMASAAVRGEVLGAGREGAGFFADLAGTLPVVPARAALEVSATIGERLRTFVRRAVAEFPGKQPAAFWKKRPPDVEVLDRRSALVAGLLDDYVDEIVRPMLRARAEVVAGLAALAAGLADWRRSRTR